MFMKYSQNQLELIQRSIQEALKEKLNKDERWCYISVPNLILGSTWGSNVDGNVWEPPTQWTEIAE